MGKRLRNKCNNQELIRKMNGIVESEEHRGTKMIRSWCQPSVEKILIYNSFP